MHSMTMLMGLPSSGKSTWVDTHPPLPVVSSDNHLEEMAIRMKSTYSQLFDANIKWATKQMNDDLDTYIKEGLDFYWDQTNLTVKTRTNKLKNIPDIYVKTVIWLDPPWGVVADRVAKRIMDVNGRVIPLSVVEGMAEALQPPTLEEGWDVIARVQM